MYKHLTLTVDHGIAILTLNRPDRLNALSIALLEEIQQAVAHISEPGSPVRCLLLTGAGRGFSSGANLADRDVSDKAVMPDLSLRLRRAYNPLIRALVDLPIPMIAAVNGPAAGAGMSLALCADFILAARSAYFLQAFVNIGLAPDAGSTYFLPRLIGPARAARLAMLGEKLPAAVAEDWGLIHKAVNDDALMDEAMTLAKKLAEGPTLALSEIKSLLRKSLDNTLENQLEQEAAAQKVLGYSEDFKAGIIGFLNKTPPHFQGK